MKHGGDILSCQQLYNGPIVDFSSNINPLGYPKILDELIPQGLSALTAYPDMYYRALRCSIADYLGCQPDQVLVGNGSMEILEHFCREAKRVVICIPSFSEYEERALVHRKAVRKIPFAEDFTLTARLLDGELREGDVLIAGNPNNPNGLRIAQPELEEIQQLAERQKAFLVLDEAFFEFCPDDYDSIQLFSGKKNVCVIRAATKFFGLPGLRLGYACAVEAVARCYADSALPWRINAFADLAGRSIFTQDDYIRRSKKLIEEQRRWMLAQLKLLKGVQVFPTDSNFILVRLLELDEDELFKQLIRKGLMIRKASSFEGLGKDFVRIAVKNPADNQRLLTALQAADC
ncbi:aspartate aminotransferase [candidate division KSB3 bacterium]|uniref:Aspartate aminotransferase n=1 Tax=candidate division KSB3 bacterium TaxID=2044937 RepID=A0A2G6EFQ7_9BACT|nr:MAG: aspartate aminotransferase [candidate division KSB3 bacterium]PIE31108.1 MAG: aspartate aminotransferase [candidate division KSB3 bacterium]